MILLPDPVVDLNDDPHLLARVERYTYRDWAHEQCLEPVCYAAIRFFSVDPPSSPPADFLGFILSAQRPLLADVLALAAKNRLPRTEDETALPVQRSPTSQPENSLPPPAPYSPRVYVLMLMRPWVLNTCHAYISLHLGVTRTVRMLARLYWWIGTDVSVRWWIRRCLHCQARKTSRHTTRWPTLSLFCQRPWHHRQRRLRRAPTSHTAQERPHPLNC